MKNLRTNLAEIINNFSPRDGLNESSIPGVHCIRFSRPDRRTKRYWRACLGIVVQGSKKITLDHEVYRCNEAHYIVTPIDLPVTSRVFSASPEKPYLCLRMDFDLLTLSEIAAQLEKDFPKNVETPLRAIFIGKASNKMMDAAIRLGKLLQTPEDAPILGPLVIKEILYHFLKGEDGPTIQQFVRTGNKTHRIYQAIYTINSELTDDLNLSALAKEANMSLSAFFKNFKAVTAMSPIQYQERLRLLEAKRLIIDEGKAAEVSAFKVGYKSASQFSREYSRMFGNSPSQDAIKIKGMRSR